MRLFHSPYSFNARRAVIAAKVLGAPVELVCVDLAKGEQKSKDFLAMNRNGRVPVLDDDGFYLTESHAIMQYLADKTPGQTLYPTDLRSRADVNRWLFWSAHHFAPSISILNWEHVVKGLIGLGPAVPAMVELGEQRVLECARVLDGHLAEKVARVGKDKAWVSGDALSLADLALATPLMCLERAKLPMSGAPHILAWFERMREMPAWKETDL
ncbi:MAG: glutathione S-transferase family protein [Polyangiaceae bacterium]